MNTAGMAIELAIRQWARSDEAAATADARFGLLGHSALLSGCEDYPALSAREAAPTSMPTSQLPASSCREYMPTDWTYVHNRNSTCQDLISPGGGFGAGFVILCPRSGHLFISSIQPSTRRPSGAGARRYHRAWGISEKRRV